MALTTKQRDDVMAFLRLKAEETGGTLGADNVLTLLFDHWEQATNLRALADQNRRSELDRLKANKKTHTDAIAAIDDRINELQTELGAPT